MVTTWWRHGDNANDGDDDDDDDDDDANGDYDHQYSWCRLGFQDEVRSSLP